MTLTGQKKQKFVTWLETKTAINFKCGICTGSDFGVLDEIIYLKTADGPGAYYCVGLICTCCKNIQTIDATDSGVMEPDEITGIVCQECFNAEATMYKGDNEVEVCSECYNRD